MAKDKDQEQLAGHVTSGKTYGFNGKIGDLARFVQLQLTHNQYLWDNNLTPVSFMIWGEPGIGKTQFLKDLSHTPVQIGDKVYQGIKIVYIPVAQLEEMGDFHGLPIEMTIDGETITRIVDGQEVLETLQRKVTTTAPPDWVPIEEGPGIVILDDFNRAGQSIIQGLMQLVLDYLTVNWYLPKYWTIAATGNPEQSSKHKVQYMDIAQLSRLAHFTLVPDALHWASWAENNGVSEMVRTFILRYEEKMCQGERVNPRTYTMFGRQLEQMKVTDDETITLLGEAFLDSGTVAQFLSFVKNDIGLSIKPEHLLNNYETSEERRKLTAIATSDKPRMDIVSLTANRLAAYIDANDLKLTKKQGDNFVCFLCEQFVPNDLTYGVCKHLSKNSSIGEVLGNSEELLKRISDSIG